VWPEDRGILGQWCREYQIENISDTVELDCSTDEATTLTGNPSPAKSNITIHK
jgi:hypothetical protein